MSGAKGTYRPGDGSVREDTPEAFAPGPAEKALSARIAAHLEAHRAPWTTVEMEVSPPGSSRLGEFRFEVSRLCTPEGLTNKALVELLKQLPEVGAARVLFPWAYVTPTTEFLHEVVFDAVAREGAQYGAATIGHGRRVILSFSDPNLNKPLHVGHLRNNVVGMALGALLEAMGYDVARHAVHSDWGRHICQAITVFLRQDAVLSPELLAGRGDVHVGALYQRFHELRREAASAMDDDAASLLTSMEAGDEGLADLNEVLTCWVERGITATYRRIGTRFDRVFRESDHRDVAYSAIDTAMERGTCVRSDDGSVHVLSERSDPPEIYLVRRDGTLLVLAQLLGADICRFQGVDADTIIQLQGREWESGNLAYAEVVERMGLPWSDRCEYVQHGMVCVQGAKLKSREGSSLSADMLLDRVRDRVRGSTTEADSVADEAAGRSGLWERVALASVKWHLLRVRRSQDVEFDEERLSIRGMEAIDAIMTTLHAVRSWLDSPARPSERPREQDKYVRRLVLDVNSFPKAVKRAADERDPSYVARLVESIVAGVGVCSKQGVLTEAMVRGIDCVVTRGMSLLNIELREIGGSVSSCGRR